VTGRPAEDFETIARRYAVQPRNQRTLGNWLREFALFMMAPLSPGFNFERYHRELRRPFPSWPQSAPESKVWRHEHAITDSQSFLENRYDRYQHESARAL
jgi:NAD(P)H dehydrogenase (quinone)